MRSFWSGILLTALAVSTAQADEKCPALTFITTVDMRIGVDGRPYVPVEIDGIQKFMLVDTGGSFTMMRPETATQLNLESRTAPIDFIGIAGDSMHRAVTAPFRMGNLKATSMDFVIIPDTHKFAADIPDVAGIVAPNLLTGYDADFDFGKGKMNLLSQNHCDGHVVYWSDTAAIVPMRLDRYQHIILPVVLDGHAFDALLDTGASRSVLNLSMAGELGLQPGNADTPVVGHLDDADASAIYRHKFQSLSIEGVAISNPTMDLLPDRISGRNPNAGTANGETRIHHEIKLDDVILGMDVLKKLHLYIAYKEQKLYITGASVGLPPAPPH